MGLTNKEVAIKRLIEKMISEHNLDKLKKVLSSQSQKFDNAALAFVIMEEEYKLSRVSFVGTTSVEGKEEASTRIKAQAKELVKFLLDLGADVNADVSDVYTHGTCTTAFEFACWKSSVDVVRMMIDRGANFKLEKIEDHPIQLAFRSGDQDKVKLFFDLGITGQDISRLHLLNEAVQSGKTPLELVSTLVDLGADVNGRDADGCTVLHGAAATGSFEVVKFLVENGAKVNETSGDEEETSLGRAVFYGNLKIVKYLLENGADLYPEDECLLTVAAARDRREMVKFLLDLGVDVNGRDPNFDRTPVSYAAENCHEEMVKLLLERGARQDDSLLFDAINQQEKFIGVLKLLLNRGSNPNGKLQGRTALCYASYMVCEEAASVLLDYGADIEAESEDGMRPLNCAVEEENRKTLVLLLDRGADTNAECKGETPLTMALRLGCETLYRLLIKEMMMRKVRKMQSVEISETNLSALEANKNLKVYQGKCACEIELLRKECFVGSLLSYFDLLATNNIDQLGALVSNENVAEALKMKKKDSEDLEKKFPIYNGMIMRKLRKGASRNSDFILIKRFFRYLSDRNHDQLPQLPFVVVQQVFSHLSFSDVANFQMICS